MSNTTQKVSLYFFATIYLVLNQYIQYNAGGAGTDLPYNLTSILGIVLFCSWGLLYFSNAPYVRVSPQTKWLFWGLSLICLPLFYSHSAVDFIAGHYLFSLWLCLLVYFILDQMQITNSWRNQLILLMVGGALIQALSVIWQFTPGLPNDFFPTISRPTGIFGQTNLLASYMAMGLGLSFYFLIKNKRQQLLRYQKILFLTGIPLFSGILASGGSRVGLISLLLILIIASTIALKYSQKRLFAFVLLSWLGATTAFILVDSSSSGSTELLAHKATNAGQRGFIYPAAINLLSENFIEGIGFGKFERAIFDSTLEQTQKGKSDIIINSLQHPHNELLYLAIQGGVVSILGLLAIAAIIFRTLGRRPILTLLRLLPMLGLIIHAMFELPLVASFPHLLSLFLVLYLVSGPKPFIRYHNVAGAYLFKPVATIFGIGGILFYTTGLHTLYLTFQYRVLDNDTSAYLNIINPYIQRTSYLQSIHAMQLAHQPISNIEATQNNIEFYQELIRYQPRPQYFNNLCLAYLKLNDINAAQTTLNQAKGYFPENFMDNNSIKKCEQQLERFKRYNSE